MKDKHTAEDKRKYFESLMNEAFGRYLFMDLEQVAEEDRPWVKDVFMKGYASAVADRMNGKWAEAGDED